MAWILFLILGSMWNVSLPDNETDISNETETHQSGHLIRLLDFLTSNVTSHDAKFSSARAEVLLNSIADKVISFATALQNFLNGETDIDVVDTFMSAVNTLFNSNGMTALNNYYTVFSNYFVVIDAVAYFIRVTEVRIRQHRWDREDLARAEERALLVEKVIDRLVTTNVQLNRFRKNVEILMCRRAANSIKRKGLRHIRQVAGKQPTIDCSSLLKRRRMKLAKKRRRMKKRIGKIEPTNS